MIAGDHRPCEEAEITFGTVRACAMYADVQAENYQYLQPMEVLSSSTVVAVPEMGCSPLENGVQMAGNIAVITRGACTFTEKALNAQAAGAVAVIITDDRVQGLDPMPGNFSGVTIPAMMVTQDGGARLRENSGRACAIRIGNAPCRDDQGHNGRGTPLQTNQVCTCTRTRARTRARIRRHSHSCTQACE